jgi:hypothetical protein
VAASQPPKPVKRMPVPSRTDPNVDFYTHSRLLNGVPATPGPAVASTATSPAITPFSITGAIRDWDTNVPPSVVHAPGNGITVKAWAQAGPGQWAFLLDRLELPREKGEAIDTWRAQKDRLQVARGRQKTIKQYRPGTSSLRQRWLAKVGWEAMPEERWAAAAACIMYAPAGQPKRFDPKLRGGPNNATTFCDIDHIVELQFLGDNSVENLQVLDSDENQTSGRKLNEFITGATAGIRGAAEAALARPVDVVLLQFERFLQPNGPICGPGCMVERIARQDILDVLNGTALAESGKETYDIVASHRTTLFVDQTEPGTRPGPEKIRRSALARNRAAALLIPGLILERLERSPNGQMDEIFYTIDERFNWPFTIKQDPNKTYPNRRLSVDPVTRAVGFKDPNPELTIAYPHLSQGKVLQLSYDPASGLSGRGLLKPSIPILRALDLGFSFTPDSFEFTTGLDPESLKKITAPFPGFEITDASLAFLLWPDFIPSGRIAFAYGPKDNRLVTGMVTASADEKGFRLDGMLMANIPRVDNAAGTVSYSARRWSGQIDIASSQIKIPGYRSGSFQARLVDNRLRFGGRVLLGVQLAGREQMVRLGLEQRDNGRFFYTGDATLDLPRVQNAKLSVSYDGETLRGRGQGSIAFRGFEGTLRSLDFSLGADGTPVVSGMGMVKLPGNERTEGSIDVALSPQGRFSGSGMVRYKISDNLTADARVVLGEDEKLRVEGALRLRRIELFPAATGMRQLFRLPHVRIPIPQASIGGYGVAFTIDAGVDASYSFGPGALEDVILSAAVSPLERNSDFNARIMGSLVVPAAAGLTATLRGGLGLDVGVGSATGGVTLTGAATLSAAARVGFAGDYERGRYQIQATPAVMGNVSLQFGVDGDARVELAGQELYRRTWMLASYMYPSLLQFGVGATVGYDSANGFKPPSITNLQLTRPPFMLGGLLDRLV